MTLRIVHLTTVHSRYDIRIFHKECMSLARHWDTHLIVADGKGDETVSGVNLHDVGKSTGRLARMAFAPWRVYRRARYLAASIYHFHDPELIPVGLLLRWHGAHVIYDAHEDLPRQILDKYWLPRWSRRIAARLFERLEDFAARRFSAVVGATPHITERFRHVGARAENINNFPLPGELEAPGDAPAIAERDERTLCYIGGISAVRGIRELIMALPAARATLLLAGPFENANLEAELRAMPQWKHVRYYGVVDRQGVRDIMARSRLGAVLFHPSPNHVNALPNKMFEYMSAGIPVLASDFPLWRSIIDICNAGRCVDPNQPEAIATAINEMFADEIRLAQYGLAGRKAVETQYNWSFEKLKLYHVYRQVLAATNRTPCSL